jgi:hypothetical protein
MSVSFILHASNVTPDGDSDLDQHAVYLLCAFILQFEIKKKTFHPQRGRKGHFRGTTSICWTSLFSTLITPTNIRASL